MIKGEIPSKKNPWFSKEIGEKCGEGGEPRCENRWAICRTRARERERERHERLRYPRSARGVLEAGAKRFRDYEGDASVHLVQKAQRLRVHVVHDETLPQAGLRGRSVSFDNDELFHFFFSLSTIQNF